MATKYEQSDISIRAVFGFGAWLTAVAVVMYVVVWLLFSYLDRREAATAPAAFPLAVGNETRLPPEPRLQVNPREDLERLRARHEEALNSYQWVDRASGIVRIPIAEAMRLTLQRGLPSRDPAAAQPTGTQPAGAQATGAQPTGAQPTGAQPK